MSTQLAPSSETSALSNNASSKPLEKFTLFPKLSPELQIRIFKFALPDGHKGKRLLPVKLRLEPLGGSIKMTFEVARHPHIMAKDLFHIGLSGACYDSRKIYEAAFPKVLPYSGLRGQIRYRNANTLLWMCIGDFSVLGFDVLEFESIESRHQWWKEIQHMAIPWREFRTAHRSFVRAVDSCPKLKQIVAIYPHRYRWSSGSITSTMITDIEEQLDIIRGYLSKDGRNPCVDELDHSIPKIFCMDMDGILLDGSGKEYEFPGENADSENVENVENFE